MRHLYASLWLFLLLIFVSAVSAFAQDPIIAISGTIRDNSNHQALPGVSVSVKGGTIGTQSDANGAFALKERLQFPFTLVFSYIGYETREIQVANASSRLQVSLESKSVLTNEVVVSASRVEESRLKSPVAIEKLDIRAIKETPAPSFYDALENVKGVQMTTSSLTFKVPNTRGFNIPNNFRFMQLVDGVDMQDRKSVV